MPIYEYSCANCRGRFQKLVSGFSDPAGLICPRCNSTEVQRAVSRFATVRSEEAKLDALSNPAMFSGLDENDPQSIARWAKKLGKELGDEAGEDWNEMVDEMMEEEMAGESGEDDVGETKSSKKASKADNLGWA
jgi:putative FmdB family regulatory protein